MIKPRFSSEEVADLGEAVFERDIAAKLRGQDLRNFVAIDVHSGDYEVDAEAGPAIRRLLDRHPEARFWLRRVGSGVAHSFGPRLTFEPLGAMIAGAVYGQTEPIVELTVRGPEGQEERLDFKVDTGFDGALTLHSAVVSALGLQPLGVQRVSLADGSVIVCDLCDGFVDWNGVARSVEVQVSDSVSLLGMALLAGHQVRIDVVDGGAVRISPLWQQLS